MYTIIIIDLCSCMVTAYPVSKNGEIKYQVVTALVVSST